jgi:lysozyme family protein
LASGLDWAVFDFALESETGRAARSLQQAVGATEDGSIAPLTLMVVKKHEVANIINRIAMYREEFYRSLSTFDTFGRGWLRWNDETKKQALAMG